jgi:hypothetical protein
MNFPPDPASPDDYELVPYNEWLYELKTRLIGGVVGTASYVGALAIGSELPPLFGWPLAAVVLLVGGRVFFTMLNRPRFDSDQTAA